MDFDGAGDEHPWPLGLMGRVAKALPSAGAAELDLLRRGFESYLWAVKKWGPQAAVAMPSRSVDEVWHNAMLHSKFYQELCEREVGWFVHHDPGPMPGGSRLPTAPEREAELDALARAWVGACEAEGFDPFDGPVPCLFAADSLLGVEGFRYSIDDELSCLPISRIRERAKALPEPAKPGWMARLRRSARR
jgi:hypothetical protein